jgi:integrase
VLRAEKAGVKVISEIPGPGASTPTESYGNFGLDRYSRAYASNQYRALQQFFKWLAAEDQLPDPMSGLQPPRVTGKLVPVFTGDSLSALLGPDISGVSLRGLAVSCGGVGGLRYADQVE